MANDMKKESGWITINDQPQHKMQRTEKEERERLLYWSNRYAKKYRVSAGKSW